MELLEPLERASADERLEPFGCAQGSAQRLNGVNVLNEFWFYMSVAVERLKRSKRWELNAVYWLRLKEAGRQLFLPTLLRYWRVRGALNHQSLVLKQQSGAPR